MESSTPDERGSRRKGTGLESTGVTGEGDAQREIGGNEAGEIRGPTNQEEPHCS